ncbi:MAG: glutathione S-transferase N-terminal domain-containing protein [Parvularculales bacterium]
MIDLYTWTTPNGYKVSMMLEETGLDYTVHPVNISEKEQSKPEFLAISPNGKIPAIVDGDLSIFDSGAILIYLAEKTGKFLPTETAARYRVMQWLMFQMAHIGPMIGQLAWFTRSAPEQVPLAIDRYMQESARLLGVMTRQLEKTRYIADDDYSIADIALYGWVSLAHEPVSEAAGDAIGDATALKRWLKSVGGRPATVKGMAIPKVD